MAAVSSPVNKKRLNKTVIILALFLLAGAIFFRTAKINGKQSVFRSTALIECYRAEILMRIADVSDLLAHAKSVLQPNKISISTREPIINQASDLLNKAHTEEPDNTVILCKKIILDAHINKDTKSDLDKLALLSARENEKTATREKTLADLILSLYSQKEQCSLPANAADILQNSLSDSWYRERALLKIYAINNQNEKYQDLLSEIQNKTWRYILKLGLLTIGGTIAAILGVIIILYQIIIPPKKDTQLKEQFPANENSQLEHKAVTYGWQTVCLVFLAWFFTQIFMAYIASLLKQKGLLISYSNSLSSAISIVLLYLLSNGPALLYIYFFALVPNGQGIIDGLNLRLKANSHGIIALVIIGLLGWLAAMPIVIAAYFISAQFFGSNGSSNPIIGIVMQAAQANNYLAVLLFYFALGVLAPFCEESLFRGFLYNYLRSRFSVAFSIILSSALFSLAHFDIGAALPLFCLGSVFAYLRERTGSIVPSIIAHGIWNSATFTLVLLLFGN